MEFKKDIKIDETNIEEVLKKLDAVGVQMNLDINKAKLSVKIPKELLGIKKGELREFLDSRTIDGELLLIPIKYYRKFQSIARKGYRLVDEYSINLNGVKVISFRRLESFLNEFKEFEKVFYEFVDDLIENYEGFKDELIKDLKLKSAIAYRKAIVDLENETILISPDEYSSNIIGYVQKAFMPLDVFRQGFKINLYIRPYNLLAEYEGIKKLDFQLISELGKIDRNLKKVVIDNSMTAFIEEIKKTVEELQKQAKKIIFSCLMKSIPTENTKELKEAIENFYSINIFPDAELTAFVEKIEEALNKKNDEELIQAAKEVIAHYGLNEKKVKRGRPSKKAVPEIIDLPAIRQSRIVRKPTTAEMVVEEKQVKRAIRR